MADEDTDQDSKTEEPTAKKLEDALKKGQVVNSKEVTSFIMILLLSMVIIWILPASTKFIAMQLRFFIENAGNITINEIMLGLLFPKIIKNTLLSFSPILSISFIAAITSSYFQHGTFILSLDPVIPKLSKISIAKGFGRLFSMKNVVEFLKGIFKISLVGAFVIMVMLADVKELSQYQELSVAGILNQLFTMVKHILILVTILVAAIAMVDFSYQSYSHHQELKMTKHEVKQEHKQTEGSPEIKQKIRQLRQDQSQKRIKVTVPNATVVITNPEHYAIALKYDMASDHAPICVAKGLDLIAHKIKEIATTHDIPIVENPPVARALYRDVDINAEIPVEHFEEVAKIMSYVMSLERQAKENKQKN